MDAPFHFSDEGETIENMDMSLFQGRAVAVDLRNIQSQAIMAEHLSHLQNV